jgi:hypothetical protein
MFGFDMTPNHRPRDTAPPPLVTTVRRTLYVNLKMPVHTTSLEQFGPSSDRPTMNVVSKSNNVSTNVSANPTTPKSQRCKPFDDTNGSLGVNFETLLSSDEATYLLKAKLVGSLARWFPQLDRELLWNSISEAFGRLQGCEDGDVEKLGVVDFVLDKPNNVGISPPTSIWSLDGTTVASQESIINVNEAVPDFD